MELCKRIDMYYQLSYKHPHLNMEHLYMHCISHILSPNILLDIGNNRLYYYSKLNMLHHLNMVLMHK
jgi:hypothetical protein